MDGTKATAQTLNNILDAVFYCDFNPCHVSIPVLPTVMRWGSGVGGHGMGTHTLLLLAWWHAVCCFSTTALRCGSWGDCPKGWLSLPSLEKVKGSWSKRQPSAFLDSTSDFCWKFFEINIVSLICLCMQTWMQYPRWDLMSRRGQVAS